MEGDSARLSGPDGIEDARHGGDCSGWMCEEREKHKLTSRSDEYLIYYTDVKESPWNTSVICRTFTMELIGPILGLPDR